MKNVWSLSILLFLFSTIYTQNDTLSNIYQKHLYPNVVHLFYDAIHAPPYSERGLISTTITYNMSDIEMETFFKRQAANRHANMVTNIREETIPEVYTDANGVVKTRYHFKYTGVAGLSQTLNTIWQAEHPYPIIPNNKHRKKGARVIRTIIYIPILLITTYWSIIDNTP